MSIGFLPVLLSLLVFAATTPLALASDREQRINFNADRESLPNCIGVVPRGTELMITMESCTTPKNVVSSETSMEGDEFSARVPRNISIDDSTLLTTRDVIRGRIGYASGLAGRGHKHNSASIELKFDWIIRPDNRQIPIAAHLCSRDGVLHVQRGLKNITLETKLSQTRCIPLVGGTWTKEDFDLAIRNQPIVDVLQSKRRIVLLPGDRLNIELKEGLCIPAEQNWN